MKIVNLNACPARAGVIPSILAGLQMTLGLPRTSGGDPTIESSLSLYVLLAPHERG